MILFFLKKNFCDGWDNLLWLVLFNLILLAIFAGSYFIISALMDISALIGVPSLIIFTCLFMLPLFSISDSCSRLADFKSASIKETFARIPHVWKDALPFGLTVSLIIFMALVGIPFYFSMGNIVGLFLGAFIFWVLLISLLALQWFMPLRSRFGGGFRKNLKKSFIMFFDNLGFSIFIALYSLFLFAISGFVAFMAPGPSGLLLGYNNALRLRSYKYDWLDAHPEIPSKEARKTIPWDELIAADNETLGPRDFKSFIFPWK